MIEMNIMMIVVDADDAQVLGVRETNWCFQGIAYVLHLRIPNKPQTIAKAESEKSIETPTIHKSTQNTKKE